MKAFCFDVLGTVVDWRTGIAREAESFFASHGISACNPFDFADAWRRLYQPSMEACRTGRRTFTKLDILHRENLEAALNACGIDPNSLESTELDGLNDAWHRLDPWPDVIDGLVRLKAGYIIAPASNGNVSLLVDMAKRAGLPWDLILGAEVTQAYKPSALAYTRMADLLDIERSEICMVAAHNSDLEAARLCGLATAFVPRITEHGEGQSIDLVPSQEWDIIATDFNDLADKADY